MVNTNYTTTDNKELKQAFSNDLNIYLKDTKPDWQAFPATITGQVFIIKSGDPENYNFEHLCRIGVANDEKDGQYMYMTAYHDIKDTPQYDLLINNKWKNNGVSPSESPVTGFHKKLSDVSELSDVIGFIEDNFREN